MSEALFDVRRFGATGIAKVSRTHVVQNPKFSITELPIGLEVPIYDTTPGMPHDSVGIQRAIDAAHEAGGGTVYVPAGNYLISPIELRSRVNLHLACGAYLWASPHLDDYFKGSRVILSSVDQGFARTEAQLSGCNKRRLICAEDAEDVSITGMGAISAQSLNWIVPWLNSQPDQWLTERPTDTFIFHRCKRIRIENIRILDTPAWTLVFDNCDQVSVRGIEIRSADVLHSDGIDLVNSSNATISDCRIHCTDDAICLKNTQPDKTMSNVVVTNCIIRTLCNGLKIGTDTTGNFQNITFNNIVIQNPPEDVQGAESGICLCALDGGFVRHINISNVIMHGVQCPFYMVALCRKKNQKHFRKPRPGQMSDVSLSNIQAFDTRAPAFIVGDETKPISDVMIHNVRIKKTDGHYSTTPPKFAGGYQYPTPYMFGEEPNDHLPAYGLYLHNTVRVHLRDIETQLSLSDIRPEIKIDSKMHDR